MTHRVIQVNDLMQQGYEYTLTSPMGRDFRPDFHAIDAKRDAGVGGLWRQIHRRNALFGEFPADWFENAKLSPARADPSLNFFGVSASKPLSYWRAKGWSLRRRPKRLVPMVLPLLHGRRSRDDDRQVKRWIAMRRHVTSRPAFMPRKFELPETPSGKPCCTWAWTRGDLMD